MPSWPTLKRMSFDSSIPPGAGWAMRTPFSFPGPLRTAATSTTAASYLRPLLATLRVNLASSTFATLPWTMTSDSSARTSSGTTAKSAHAGRAASPAAISATNPRSLRMASPSVLLSPPHTTPRPSGRWRAGCPSLVSDRLGDAQVHGVDGGAEAGGQGADDRQGGDPPGREPREQHREQKKQRVRVHVGPFPKCLPLSRRKSVEQFPSRGVADATPPAPALDRARP